MRNLTALVAVLVMMASPVLAAGTLTYTTTYDDHPVSGTTAAAIYHDENVHPIVDPDDGAALANLTHAHDIRISTAPLPGGQCKVASLSFDWHFVVTLPKAVDAAHLPAPDRRDWSAFVARLRWHEEHHRAIFLDCGHDFVPAAAAMTGLCTGLEQQVRDALAKAYDACMIKQRAFDAEDTGKVMQQPFIQLARAER